LRYEITTEKDGNYGARVRTFGIARHPAQLMNPFPVSCSFIFLFWLWKNQEREYTPGRIFGWFLVDFMEFAFLPMSS